MTTEWLDVSDVTPRISYTATAAQTAFVVPFIFFEDSNLKVYQNGVLKTLATHYTVAGAEAEAGGTVTLLTGATLADEIMIVREVPLEQTTHIPPSGPLDIPAINIQISKLVTMMQELDHGLARSIRLADNLPGELEIAEPVASEFLKWNATADGVESAAVTATGEYPIATQSEAEAGTLNNVLMTPLRVAQAAATVITDTAPGIMAWEHGVTGDGTDQTIAFQAMVDAAHASGATIYLRGSVVLTGQIDLTGRSHLTFIGVNGTGGAKASIDINTGATGGLPAIKAYGTVGVSFEGVNVRQYSAAFDGHVLSYGDDSALVESAFMRIKDCHFTTISATAKALSLNRATNGSYQNVVFQGAGTLVNLKQGTGYSNIHNFWNCTFQPGAALASVLGAGACINFYGCCFQAGSTGQTLAWQCNSGHQFLDFNFHGCDFLDATLGANPWIIAPWGNGLTVTGCYMGGPGGCISVGGAGSGDPQDSGMRGLTITGNSFAGVTNAIAFGGTIAAKTNVRGAYIAGNSVTVGALVSSWTEVEQLMFGPNSIYGSANEIGAHFALVGIPAHATNAAAISAGMGVGQVYRVGNVLQIV